MTRPVARPLAVLLAAIVAAVVALPATAQQDEDRVLVYSRTAGFRHLSIPDGIAAIEELGAEHGFAVEATEDPGVFTDDTLAGFDAVVFLNTTGEVMTDAGRAAFERFVDAGGGWIGVHSAADTEYDWGFYGELLGGAWFLSHPVQQPGTLVNEAPDQPSTAHLPERWTLPLEEFYSFQRNPRDRVRVLLSIDESTYQQDPNTSSLPSSPEFPPTFPEGQTGVMGDHPMSWCLDVGEGRGWYTALGHESYLYRLPEYRQHLLGGIRTALQDVEADCAGAPADTPAPTDDPEGAPAPDPDEAAAPDAGAPPPDPAPDARGPLPATGVPAGLAAVGALLAAVLAVGRRRA